MNIRSSKLVIVVASVVLAVFAVTAKSAVPQGKVPGRWVVKLAPKANPVAMRLALADGERLQKASSLTLAANIEGGEAFDLFYFFNSSDLSIGQQEVADRLGAANIEYVEPDYYLEFFDWPTDPFFADQWYLHNTGQDYVGVDRIDGDFNDTLIIRSGTAGVDIGMDAFYDTQPTEATRVVVAIVDSGVDRDHPELQGAMWQNVDEIPDNGIDDDHNGYVDDAFGYDISGDSLTIINVVGDADPTDFVGHGTHLAGIVASRANEAGISGIAQGAEIMPVKIMPNGTAAVGAVGIMYAVNAGAQVINISWGSPFESGILREALLLARRNGVFVSIAPGNTGTTQRFFPAAFDSSFVVAAGNSDGYLTDFTTYGAHIDLVAPGQDILSLRAAGTDMAEAGFEPGVRIIGDDSLYYLGDGTSMAAPMVAGAAAFLLSIRPDLSLDHLEQILTLGAVDMVDPFNRGDELIGADTLSGHGYLDIASSYSLLIEGGLQFVLPARRHRYTDDLVIKIAPVSGYYGAWQLDYTVGFGSDDWQPMADGSSLPVDSIAYAFDNGQIEGDIKLRLTDKNGRSRTTGFIYVRQRCTEMISPTQGAELKYNVLIRGSVYGPDYDSMAVFYQRGDGPIWQRFASTGEFFDSLIYIFSASGADTGDFRFYLHGYYQATELVDTVAVMIESSFTDGWPQQIASKGAISPVCTDLDRDGFRELVVASGRGLYLFHSDGTIAAGFPVLPQVDMRCIPAVYDIDHDGEDEIICTNDSGIYVFNRDGSIVPGWPQYCYTGSVPYGYGYPNPTIVGFSYYNYDNGQRYLVADSAIVIINLAGHILAYDFDGRSHFASLGGLFALFDARSSEIYREGGEVSPFVTSVDIEDDGPTEVVASYSSGYPYTGVGVFKSINGQPAYDINNPVVVTIASVRGTALADLDGDERPEIITVGVDTASVPGIWVTTNGSEPYPGFPVRMPAAEDWIVSYPVIADLDLDGSPEILLTAFEFDVTSLYIFKADGTPYLSSDGRPEGEALVQGVTFATPTVANVLGDDYPEILIRSGYIMPGGGEKLYVLNHQAQIVPGWPIYTPSRANHVLSSRYAPLVDDLDGDGLVEVVLVGDDWNILVWDFEASYDDGNNKSRFLYDNINSGYYRGNGFSVDVEEQPPVLLPARVELYPNYPNPFNPITRILFALPSTSHVTLEVLNILGQAVTTLIDEHLPAGLYRTDFDGSDFASGVYFYRLNVGDRLITRKMVLLK